jgi:hypothetical protein
MATLGSWLSLGVLLLGAADPVESPDSLVERLGSARYADREAASRALEGLGRDALELLREARNDPDAEIRNRAEVVLERIERGLLIDATKILLQPKDRTIRHVVERLIDAQGIPLTIDEPGLGDRLSLLPDGERAPTFWSLIERLGLEVAQVQERVGYRREFNRITRVKITTRPSADDRRTQLTGPFRVVLEPMSAGRNAEEGVYALVVAAEPRIALRAVGPVSITEVVDDLDRTWAAVDRSDPDDRPGLANEPALMQQVFALRLTPPKGPPAKHLRIRGSIPLELECRRLESVSLDLPEQHGKPQWCGDVTLIARETSPAPAARPATGTLDLTLRPPGWTTAMINRGGRRFIDPFFNSDIERIFRGLEFYDEEGRPIRALFPRQTRSSNEGIRVILDLELPEPESSVAEIRYFGRTRIAHNLEFSFKAIPLR